MTDCTPTPIDDRWGVCRVCDPEGERPMPLHARRNCGRPSGDPPAAPSPATIESQVRQAVMARRAAFDPEMTFEAVLRWLGARPWPEIQRTVAACVRCDQFAVDRCTRRGTSCQARSRWISDILRRPCRHENGASPAASTPTSERFVRLADLHADTLKLIPRLPPDLTAICGAARSGLIPASILACMLQLPLWSVSKSGVLNLGFGTRLRDRREPRRQKILLLDDTAYRGQAMERNVPLVRERFPDAELIRAVIYTTPNVQHLVDVFVTLLPRPHWLEWHLFNSPIVNQAAFDFDGILCEDISQAMDDDGPRYRRALAQADPKYLARHTPIPLVVTARLERYRELTDTWLKTQGIVVRRLIMGPWASLAERNRPGNVAAYKARHYRESRLTIFIESDPRQAREIARQAAKTVLCPSTAEVFRGG